MATIVFVPFEDYSTNAFTAQTQESADLGFIRAGDAASISFRIGNVGTGVQSLTLSTTNPLCSLSAYIATIAAGDISDTLTATVSVPVDTLTSVDHSLIVAGDNELYLSWEAIGANVDRLPQIPERAGQYSDDIAEVIYSAGEPLRLYRFDPIPYDASDNRIFVGGNGTRFSSQANVCCRLDPLDERWGYRLTTSTIVGSFQSENWSISEQITVDDSAQTWTGNAVLYLPAEYELIREWALFAPARGIDKPQYKRTVFLTQRQGQVWCLHTIVPVYRGDQLAYWECRLIPLSDASIGNQGHYNPFSVTYQDESDRPYAQYLCSIDVAFTEIVGS